MRFYDVGSDVNWIEYGGNWAAKEVYDKSAKDGITYHVVQFINWESETGNPTVTEYNGSDPCKYVAEVRSIDMTFYDQDKINRALDTCGQEHDTTGLAMAQCMASYGYGDVRTYYGNNAYKLLKLAKDSVR